MQLGTIPLSLSSACMMKSVGLQIVVQILFNIVVPFVFLHREESLGRTQIGTNQIHIFSASFG